MPQGKDFYIKFDERMMLKNVCPITGMISGEIEPAALDTYAHTAAIRDRIENVLADTVEDMIIVGKAQRRFPSISCIAFDGANGEVMRQMLLSKGIIVKTASKCDVQAGDAPSVLQMLGIPFSYAKGAMIFSIGRDTTLRMADVLLRSVPSVVEGSRSLAAR